MKESKYNYSFEDGDNVILFNARTNALAKMAKQDFKKFTEYVLDNENIINNELKKSLVYGGYIVEDDVDELEMIRHNVLASRFASNVMNLTIAPTSDCNFRCPYCYERSVLRPGKMNDETANDIICFINNQIHHLDSLNITWYGGEPLLEIDRLLGLSNQIITSCEQNDVKYFGSIITNGYLLDLETLRKLINVKIKHIQITLDGPKEYHDNRRYRIGKKPTFDQIISNLSSFSQICSDSDFPLISVRMNLDRNNIDGLKELAELLNDEPFNKYIYFYIASVYDKNDKENKYTFTPEEFNKIDGVFKKAKLTDYQQFYPTPPGVHCVCDSLNGFVIDADGSLYKCWEEMGNKKLCIGNIHDFEFNVKSRFYYDYLLFDPTINENCKNCEVLPACMGGGCPNRIIRNEYKPNCENIIDLIHENIKASYRLMDNDVKRKGESEPCNS